MVDENEKRRLLGIDDSKPLPTFGKRKPKQPAVTEDKTSERDLEEFRNEARSLLQKGRERAEEDEADARAAGKKASILNLIRKKRKDGEPDDEDELTDEEEWHRLMAAASKPEDMQD